MAGTREIALDFFQRLEKSDFVGAFGMLAERAQYTVVGSTAASGVYAGREDLMRRLGPQLDQLKNLKTTLRELIVEGDRAVAIMRGEADAPFGPYVQDPAVFIIRVADGEVLELLELVDTVMLETKVFGKTLVAGGSG